tara:strand:+ start:1579 stop:1908 length:330 start_codon:yes stop_codon:yes gene_type:complete
VSIIALSFAIVIALSSGVIDSTIQKCICGIKFKLGVSLQKISLKLSGDSQFHRPVIFSDFDNLSDLNMAVTLKADERSDLKGFDFALVIASFDFGYCFHCFVLRGDWLF